MLERPTSLRFRLPPGGLLTVLLAFLTPRDARAEDSVSYKFQSWQEDGDRIQVSSHYGLIEGEISPGTRAKVMGLIDSISGATPTGEIAATPGGPVPMAEIRDLRRAWDAGLSHQFERVNVSGSFGISEESDYVSRGWSLNTLTDFNQKNTAVLFGYGRTDDEIQPEFWRESLAKKGDDLILGVTQLLDPVTQLTANLSVGQARGYLADPYKFVSKTILFDTGVPGVPPIPIPSTTKENRPDEKQKISLFLGANRYFESLDGALEGSYRFYHDDFGVTSHTVSAEWFQHLGSRLTVGPSLRYYRQSAADFYYYDLDRTNIVPATDNSSPVGPDRVGTGRAPYYSSDYRLAKMQTVTLGFKVAWAVTPWLAADFAYQRYLARGLDGETPQAVFADADVFTLGLRLSR